MASPTVEEVEVVVVGGGFCGVALGAALHHFGVSFVLLEAGPEAGAGFGAHYDRLRLHTPRHRLLHDGDLESRGGYPIYKSKNDLVRYLNEYCAYHGLRKGVELHYDSPVASVAKSPARDGWPSGWAVTTEIGRTYHAKAVALCTGAARLPHMPSFASSDRPGTLAFLQRGGEVVHSRCYRNGARFAGRDVAVVGSGNSAAEICVDLVEQGASSVTMIVTGSRHFLDLRKLSWVHRIEQALTDPQDTLDELHHIAQGSSEWAANASEVDKVLHYFSIDLSQYGITRPKLGPEVERARLQQLQALTTDNKRITTAPPRMPTLDVGLAPLLANGQVTVRQGPVEAIDRHGLQLRSASGGTSPLHCDAIVLGTGYRHGLTQLLEPSLSDVVLSKASSSCSSVQERLPITDGRCQSIVEPTLYFLGFDTTLAYGLSWGHWGWEVGERLRRQLDTLRPATAPKPVLPCPPPPQRHPPSTATTVAGLPMLFVSGVFGVGVALGMAMVRRRRLAPSIRQKVTRV